MNYSEYNFREPHQGSKKLWDKSEVDRWQHDMYDESEQGPKEQWEVEVTFIFL